MSELKNASLVEAVYDVLILHYMSMFQKQSELSNLKDGYLCFLISSKAFLEYKHMHIPPLKNKVEYQKKEQAVFNVMY